MMPDVRVDHSPFCHGSLQPVSMELWPCIQRANPGHSQDHG